MADTFKNEWPILLRSYDYGREIETLWNDAFPVIEDFVVEVGPFLDETLGRHLSFGSASRGPLASFPWWDHVEREIGGMSPLDLVGSKVSPYDDLEQGWQIVIWQDGDYVYVMQGDEPCAIEFRTWFRVPLARWEEAWTLAIAKGRGRG